VQTDAGPLPDVAVGLLDQSLPPGARKVRRFRRRKAGLGSPGKPRFAVLAEWCGGRVGREVKARTPPAGAFPRGADGGSEYYARIVGGAHRCPDPFLRLDGWWVVRRLTPFRGSVASRSRTSGPAAQGSGNRVIG
jgi:hypothetical protein